MIDYKSAIQHWVNRLSFQLRSEARRCLAAAGFDLSPEEWAMLLVLWQDGPLSVSELASRTLRDRTTVTRVLDRLVRKDLAARHSTKEDRRTVMIATTPLGNSIKADVFAAMEPLLGPLTVGLDEHDLQTTLATLKKLSSRLEPD